MITLNRLERMLIENAGGLRSFANAESLHRELTRELHDDVSTAGLIAVEGPGRVGARLRIEAAPGRGTRIEVSLATGPVGAGAGL